MQTPNRKGFVTAILMLLCLWTQAQTLDSSLFTALKPRNIGPAGMSGRVTAIDALVSNPDVIYAGTASGGLWRSESGGHDWTPIFDREKTHSIGAVAVYQKNPDVIWIGTGEGNPRNSQSSGSGVYRSIDGGKHWTCMGLEETRQIHRILIHPDNPDVVYVGAQGVAWGDSEHRGVYKTTDGGKTWEKVLYVGPGVGVADLVMDFTNPNKLFAAMWEFRRSPWIFNSGGPGSGLYVSYNGGKTWDKRTDKDGLPEGNLGRIGVAVSRSNPKVVYALVEAAKNALYRSDDGGFTWKMINDKEDIGNRPFYYSEIYVDPKNEDRLYTVYTVLSRSDDGGKSFKVVAPYNDVHPDHHALWINPEKPEMLIEGNDGGLNISYDMGKTWRFAENIPVGQFYHVRVDNDMPYNIYGGMQDNGSWRGPAYVWSSGGIRNALWTELFFGDGFDVMPDPEDSRYGYAMSQGGYLGRYDAETGRNRFIRPLHPQGTALRFNWNAGIAQDPFDAATIYYGSQFVHKSTDRGESWTLMSPDLTTNDTSKLKQNTSGGLTLDVTAAENHCTIITLSPSPVAKNQLWVGTDDGNLQLTRDGQTWTNLTSRLPGAPKNGWIPHIHASSHQAGEAYVVVNNYRQNDWKPYVYRTRDFGQTFERIVDENDVQGHALTLVQDPVQPNLLFLGTETGLYVSIDGGKAWTRWNKDDFPTTSTIDLVIHPREADLVIATFGRAFWVIDDIRPLRELATEGIQLTEKELHVFDAPDAVLASYAEANGTRFAADAIYAGENREGGAMLTFSVSYGKKKSPEAPKAAVPEPKSKAKAKKPEPAPAPAESPKAPADSAKSDKKPGADSVKVEIFDMNNELIRTLKVKADTGINRIYWGLDAKGVRFPRLQTRGGGGGNQEPGGFPILPGTYKVRMSFRNSKDSTSVRVLHDPRYPENRAALEAHVSALKKLGPPIALTTEALTRLKEAKETLGKIEGMIPKNDSSAGKELKKLGGSLRDSIDKLIYLLVPPEDLKGIYDDSHYLISQIFESLNYLQPYDMPLNATQTYSLEQLNTRLEAYIARVNAFFDKDWKAYREKAAAVPMSPFKDYEALKIKD